jgi:predicted XRE-type DNA-binding protein
MNPINGKGKLNTERLNEYIKRSGMKKKFIAERLEMATPRLSEKINGRIYLYPGELLSILHIIGIEDDVLESESLFHWYI